MIKGLKSQSCMESLKELAFSLERSTVIAIFKYMKLVCLCVCHTVVDYQNWLLCGENLLSIQYIFLVHNLLKPTSSQALD